QHQPSLNYEYATRCHMAICLIQPEQCLSSKTKQDDELHLCPGESPVRKLAAVPTISCPWQKALARGDFPPIVARSSCYCRLPTRALPGGRAAARGAPDAVAGGGWLTAGRRRRARFVVIPSAGARPDHGQIQVWRGQ